MSDDFAFLLGFPGVRVIGDVHGHADAFADLIAGARAMNYAVICLGDIVDKGPAIPQAMLVALDLVARGDGVILGSNHDEKFIRYMAGNDVVLFPNGPHMTVSQIDVFPNGKSIAKRFAAAALDFPLFIRLGSALFVHAAFVPKMLDHAPMFLRDRKDRDGSREIPSIALRGYSDGTVDANDRPTRLYDFIDQIPAGMTVFIGHDVQSLDTIIVRTGVLGGACVFLDTGVDRGGKLSHIDLPIVDGRPDIRHPLV